MTRCETGGASTGLYVHVPYCASKCPYCAFVSAPAVALPPAEAYVEALLRELDRHPGPSADDLLSSSSGRGASRDLPVARERPAVRGTAGPFGTCFVGGGTPTALAVEPLRRLLDAIRSRLGPGSEWTVEANPRTVTPAKAEALADSGVTRVSVGVQATHEAALRFLGRGHSLDDAERTVSILRTAGLDELNVDLIFGLPGQTDDAWRETLAWAVDGGFPHVALYDLTIEDETAFERDGVGTAGADRSARLYEIAIETLGDAGLVQYEVSNFARPGHECRHNLGYWTLRPYVGVGAAAHAFLGGERRWNVADVRRYVEVAGAGGDPLDGAERIEGAARAGEALALALRLPGGLSIDALPSPVGDEIRAHRGAALAALADRGLVEWDDPFVAPTRRGLFLLDDVCARLV